MLTVADIIRRLSHISEFLAVLDFSSTINTTSTSAKKLKLLILRITQDLAQDVISRIDRLDVTNKNFHKIIAEINDISAALNDQDLSDSLKTIFDALLTYETNPDLVISSEDLPTLQKEILLFNAMRYC